MAEARKEGKEMLASSSAPPEGYESDSSRLVETKDPLAGALHSLFTSFAGVVQGELQCSNSEYELLRDMNLRISEEYDNFGDFASGLRVFVERLNQKNETFKQYLQEMDGIDRQVTELEALVSTLDNYTNALHTQIRNAFSAS